MGPPKARGRSPVGLEGNAARDFGERQAFGELGAPGLRMTSTSRKGVARGESAPMFPIFGRFLSGIAGDTKR
jgi:hypothetical protein